VTELLAGLSFGGYDKFVALTNGNEWLFYTHSDDALVELPALAGCGGFTG
jgi:hypothetical protein